MVLCRHTSPKYHLGFVLYFVDLILSTCSVVIPGIWFYEMDEVEHSHVQGRSIWYLDFPTCLRGTNASHFRCVYDSNYFRAQKLGGISMVLLGALNQLLVCALFIIDNCRAHSFCINLLPEVMAGCAASLSYGGLLLYIRYTHIAVNLGYGPGVFLLAGSHVLTGIAVLLTSVHQTISPRNRVNEKHAQESGAE